MGTPLLPDQTPELLHTRAGQWIVAGYELLLPAITLHVPVVDNQLLPCYVPNMYSYTCQYKFALILR